MKVIMLNGEIFCKMNKSNCIFFYVNEEGKVIMEVKLCDNSVSYKIEILMYED